MPERERDGAILYNHPDQLGDITFNGITILDEYPIAVKVWPDGWGWVHLQVNPATDQKNMWIDGQYQSYFKYGYIEILERSQLSAYILGTATQDKGPAFLRGR